MKIFKTFAYSFIKSISTTSYYKDVLKAKLGFSMKYFWGFSFLSGIILILASSIFMVPEIN
jgi:hypothetical protein